MRARAAALLALALAAAPSAAQAPRPPVGRDAALALTYPPLRFAPEGVRRERLAGDVPVLFLRDSTLPLVTVMARFEGGYALFPRERYAAATALPGLLRYGGTTSLPPDSVDLLIETLALQMSFGSGGASVSSSVNSLTSTLDEGLALWADMLRNPRFDSAELEVWRGRELENVRRRLDDPRRLAFSEFNRIVYGDHPIGWEMVPEDLQRERLAPEVLRALHRVIVCPRNLVLGVTGDIEWESARLLLETLLDGWENCPEPLPPRPEAHPRLDPAVYLVHRDLSQSTVVMAHRTGVRQGETEDYFASRIGNAILGSSGLSSRLVTRVRTELGLAYSASSIWTTPRDADGLIGAITQTRSEGTLATVEAVVDVLEDVRTRPPEVDEVSLAVDQAVNGFVFNFQTAAQMVSRQMLYLALGLSPDWLDRYLDGIRRVEPEDVLQVFERHLRPQDLTLLVVGDTTAIAKPMERFGRVVRWDPVAGRAVR